MIRSLSRILKTAAAGLALVASASAFAQAYPNRPITLVVPWGAGGGTDATARIIGSLLEKELGQPINVVNRTGGSGVVGHQAIAAAAPDGYTLGLITVEITMMHHQKLTDLTHASSTPLALVNLDPASVPWVPSNGAAPGLQDLAAGGVEFVPCSLPEARSLIDAGKVRSLAVMADKRATLYPNVPTLKEATGSNWGTGAWRGVAAPKGIPADVRAKLEGALKKVYDSNDYQEFMASRGFGGIWGTGEEFGRFMAKGDADMKAVMTAVGIVK